MFIAGLSHKTAPIEIRERFHLNALEQQLLLSELKTHPQVAEGFVLSTCNRVEIYLHRLDGGFDTSSLIALIAKIKKMDVDFDPAPYLYSYDGAPAIEHFLRVACGLESLILGEDQILGQVKHAVETAQQSGNLSRYFNVLTNLAIRTGKKARTDTAIGHGGSSISWAAIEMAQKTMGDLSSKSVLVIGAGKMGEIALSHLHELGVSKIYLMNRTGEKAEGLAAKYNGVPASFWNIKEILNEVDICFCAVGAPHFILDTEKIAAVMQGRGGRKLVLIDISMPRNIDPQVASVPGVSLSSIDDLHQAVDSNLRMRENAVGAVEEIIRRKIVEFYEKLEKMKSDPEFSPRTI